MNIYLFSKKCNMKNEIIKSSSVYKADYSWLQTSHIFSFGDYYEPKNMWFGNMRVFNDDFIEAKTWFWMHSHSNMEILTIMLEWEITHEDSLKNRATLQKWEIQTMSAWTGIFHSEKNLWTSKTHLYQIWFYPKHLWNSPCYRDLKISLEKNTLNLLASNNKKDSVWFLDSEVKVFRWMFDMWKKFSFEIFSEKALFLYLTSWKIQINNYILEAKDQLRFVEEWMYTFEILENADFVLIECSLVW